MTVRVHSGSSVAGAPGAVADGDAILRRLVLRQRHGAVCRDVHRAFRAGRCAGNVGYSPSRTFTITGAAADTTAPVVSLSAPPASSTNTTPTFSGTAGTLAGDSSSVTVRVYAGSSVSGAAVQSLSATRSSGGSYSVGASATLAPGTYTVRADQSDASGNIGYSPSRTFTITSAAPSGDTTAPVVSLTTPLDGSASGDPVAWLGGLTAGS